MPLMYHQAQFLVLWWTIGICDRSEQGKWRSLQDVLQTRLRRKQQDRIGKWSSRQGLTCEE